MAEKAEPIMAGGSDGPWPWCDACQSYHHPENPTCYLKRAVVGSAEPLGLDYKAAPLVAAVKALGVIVLTRHIADYLERYDPQALKQAREAYHFFVPKTDDGTCGCCGDPLPEQESPAAYRANMDRLLGRRMEL